MKLARHGREGSKRCCRMISHLSEPKDIEPANAATENHEPIFMRDIEM